MVAQVLGIISYLISQLARYYYVIFEFKAHRQAVQTFCIFEYFFWNVLCTYLLLGAVLGLQTDRAFPFHHAAHNYLTSLSSCNGCNLLLKLWLIIRMATSVLNIGWLCVFHVLLKFKCKIKRPGNLQGLADSKFNVAFSYMYVRPAELLHNTAELVLFGFGPQLFGSV